MESECLEKGRKLRLIVRTWRRIHRWRWRKTMNSNSNTSGCSLPALMTRSGCKTWHPLAANSDEEYWDDDKSSSNTVAPRGHVAVYVGEERQRFVIKTEYINHPLFRVLLDEAEKEFGFHHQGPLVLPCQLAFFHSILFMLAAADSHVHTNARHKYSFSVPQKQI